MKYKPEYSSVAICIIDLCQVWNIVLLHNKSLGQIEEEEKNPNKEKKY